MSDVPVIGKESTGCPAALDSIEAYLDLEDCDRDRNSFHFRCSATMPDRTYWIWEYLDGGDNKTQFVLTQMADGSVVYGCGSADDDAFDDEQLALFLFKHNV
jgi:hypothetical protein